MKATPDNPPADLQRRCESLLNNLNIIKPGEDLVIEPLTGGVSSDIARVEFGGRSLCVKFARPKLKVEADWFAPVHRNAAEYAWLEVAARVAPESAIELYGHSQELHGFAMEFLSGETYLWKSHLLGEKEDSGEAIAVGSLLGRIHADSASAGFGTDRFQNSEDFHALRIDPYLLSTALRHSDISQALTEVAGDLHKNRQVLTHGDVSPKNILFRSTGPVLLDAECATMGDASFDISFCLNHLILKAIHLPVTRQFLLKSVKDFWSAYHPHVNWEPAKDIQTRTCKLLPMLMLARVDGKSPVEYLDASEQGFVRDVSRQLIQHPESTLEDFVNRLEGMLR